MQEYERTQDISAPANEVFAWVSDVANLPKYLPPIKEAELKGGGDRLWLRGEIPDRGEFENEGYFRVNEEERRMEWGAEVSRDYSGELEVAEAGDGECEVTVRLRFGPHSVEGDIQEESDEDRDPLAEGVEETLESIRRQIEGAACKVEPNSPED